MVVPVLLLLLLWLLGGLQKHLQEGEMGKHEAEWHHLLLLLLLLQAVQVRPELHLLLLLLLQ